MKSTAAISLSIAVVSLGLLHSNLTHAQSAEPSQHSNSTVAPVAAQREAMQMVPARAALATTLDARKTSPGHQFRATLKDTVHLKDGTELPRGTVLVGIVATDTAQSNGAARLALRFTQAELKNGKEIPIKATIVGVVPQGGSFPDQPDHPIGDVWNENTLQVDQLGALSGADLHSRIASRNSGVFVSTKKGDVKLSSGSQLTLAIAAQGGGSQNSGNGRSGGA